MRRLGLLIVTFLTACNLKPPHDGSGTGSDPDPCASTVRCQMSLSGEVTDFATGLSVSTPVTAEVTDFGRLLLSCPMKDELTLSGGAYETQIDCDSSYDLLLVLVVDDPDGAADLFAPTLVDRRVTCAGQADACQDATLAVPLVARALEQSWRDALAAEGIDDAARRGLVVVRYVERDGTPAEGVLPEMSAGPVRFIDVDRSTLLPMSTDRTGPSGLVLYAPDGCVQHDDCIAFVEGWRDDGVWPSVGVGSLRDAVYVEDVALE